MPQKRKPERLPPKQPDPDAHRIGYARVSTADQNPQLQIDALIKAGVDKDDIYEEKVSGSALKRPQLEAMMKDVREGDVVVVWKLDRLGRNAIHLHQIAQDIQEKGAHLRLLDSSGLDTTTAAGRVLFAVLAAMAQFERDLIYERTMVGLAVARANGKVGGRTARFTNEQVLEAYEKHGLLGGARSLTYKEKGKVKVMTKAGFLKALERARAAQAQKESGDEQD